MPEFGEKLSKREQEILECVVSGSGNKQIAADLHISQNTVKVHLRNIYIKLGVSSRTEATTEAIRLGLVVVPGMEETAVVEPEPTPELTPPPQTEEETSPVTNGQTAVNDIVEPTTTDTHNEDSISNEEENQKTKQLAVIGLISGVLLLLSIAAGIYYFTNIYSESEPFVEEKLSDNWVKSRPVPVTVAKAAVASFGSDLYVIGGEQDGEISNGVLHYDTVELVWENKAEKPTAVTEATATELGGIIFVFGGRTADQSSTNIVEVYSPTNDAWGTAASLPQPIAGGLALTDGSLIYFIGGTQDGDVLDTMYIYDPGSDSWRPLSNMNHARTAASGGVIGNFIYVVGGYDGQSELDVCEVYDIANDSWDSCSPMLTARGGAGTAVIINKLYTIGGGIDAANEVTFSEVYDPAVDEWSLINTPILADNPKWHQMGVSSVENKIYTLGGIRSEQEATNDNFAYVPLVYQTFIPAASSDSK